MQNTTEVCEMKSDVWFVAIPELEQTLSEQCFHSKFHFDSKFVLNLLFLSQQNIEGR